jgi:hypothetical protein
MFWSEIMRLANSTYMALDYLLKRHPTDAARLRRFIEERGRPRGEIWEAWAYVAEKTAAECYVIESADKPEGMSR